MNLREEHAIGRVTFVYGAKLGSKRHLICDGKGIPLTMRTRACRCHPTAARSAGGIHAIDLIVLDDRGLAPLYFAPLLSCVGDVGRIQPLPSSRGAGDCGRRCIHWPINTEMALPVFVPAATSNFPSPLKSPVMTHTGAIPIATSE